MTKEIKERKPRTATPIRERILRMSVWNKETDCYIWQGSLRPNSGYPQMSSTEKNAQGKYKIVFAHRAAYEAWVEPIPEGLTIDHLCGNPLCVNYKHLEPVSRQENIKRYWDKKREAQANV